MWLWLALVVWVFSPNLCGFTLRHGWIAADLGFLAGTPLDGTVAIEGHLATVTVFSQPLLALAPSGLFALMGALAWFGSRSVPALLLGLGALAWQYHVLRRASGAVARDALATLQSLRADQALRQYKT